MSWEGAVIAGRELKKAMNNKKDHSTIDKGLIALCMKMSTAERLSANDQAVSTIKELKNAFQKAKTGKHRPKRAS